jgi:FtsZ-binding cell division protein ZapB
MPDEVPVFSEERRKEMDWMYETRQLRTSINALIGQILKLNEEIKSLKDKNESLAQRQTNALERINGTLGEIKMGLKRNG